jgi:hypothetical protein
MLDNDKTSVILNSMKNAINDAESRFQILITLSIFFPVLLYNLSKVSDASETDATKMSLRIGALIGCTLIDYLIFQGCKNNLTEKSIEKINCILLWSIGFFIIPIFGLGAATFNFPKWMGNFIAVLSSTSILMVLFIPVAIEFILLIFSVISDQKKEK